MSYSGEYDNTKNSTLSSEEIEQTNLERMDELNKMLFAGMTPAQIEAEKAGKNNIDAAEKTTATGDITEWNKDRIEAANGENEPQVIDGAEFSPNVDAKNILRFAGYNKQTVGGDTNGGEREQAIANTVVEATEKSSIDSAEAQEFNNDVEELLDTANKVLSKLGIELATREEAMEMVAGASIRNNLNNRAPVENSYNTTIDRWGRSDASYALIASKVTGTVRKGIDTPLLFLNDETKSAVMNAVTSEDMTGNMSKQRGYEDIAHLGKLIENSLAESSVHEELLITEPAPAIETSEELQQIEETVPEEQLLEALLQGDDERADKLAEDLALPEDIYTNAKERTKNLLEGNRYIEKPFSEEELREIVIDMLTPKSAQPDVLRDIYDTAA